MSRFKFALDPSPDKYECPSCGERRFVRAIDTETGELIDESYGRCDREQSCGYYAMPGDDQAHSLKPKPLRHDFDLVEQSMKDYDKNNFVIGLEKIFTRDVAYDLCKKYYIGTAKVWGHSAVFWQIDEQMSVRMGKVMGYDTNLKRIKDPTPQISNIHSLMKIKNYILEQCFFGQHLLKPQSNIAVVESEKTAVICSVIYPEYTWIATGGSKNFNAWYLKKYNNVTLFPDGGMASEWSKHGFTTIDLIEDKGKDLADYIDIDAGWAMSPHGYPAFWDYKK